MISKQKIIEILKSCFTERIRSGIDFESIAEEIINSLVSEDGESRIEFAQRKYQEYIQFIHDKGGGDGFGRWLENEGKEGNNGN